MSQYDFAAVFLLEVGRHILISLTPLGDVLRGVLNSPVRYKGKCERRGPLVTMRVGDEVGRTGSIGYGRTPCKLMVT